MKIYTSYFANIKKLDKAGIKPIGIAVSPPRFFSGPTIYYVAPTRDMLSKSLSEEAYTVRYKREILGKLNLPEFFNTIKNLSFGKDIALCCYEKSGDFCHRRLLAEYIKEKTGIEIEEFGYVPPKETGPQPVQASLF